MTEERQIGSFHVAVSNAGVALVTFSRPPVNAVSLSVYEDLGALADFAAVDDAIKVLVMAAPQAARAWCGGADLNDFKGMTKDERTERYAHINRLLPRFHALECPTVAAIDKPAIGVGMVLASLFDFRVAAEDAAFALPEIDFGLLSGCAGRFMALRLPEPKLREMLYTGRKYSAREIEGTGFFNYVVAPGQALPRALALADELATKDAAAMRARKRNSLALEGSGWFEAYLDAQQASAELSTSPRSQAEVAAALKGSRS